MFTGLIDRTGEIRQLQATASGLELTIVPQSPYAALELGESIAVNGMCLTVTKITDDGFCADVSRESIHRSTIADLTVGALVNLERAMAMGDRFGGHIVSGHIDGTGKIARITPDGDVRLFEIDIGERLARWVVEKGSIAIDGISLTVAKAEAASVTIAVIPHSLAATTLYRARVGQEVNVECDMLAKYVEKILHPPSVEKESVDATEALNMDFLAENGYL